MIKMNVTIAKTCEAIVTQESGSMTKNILALFESQYIVMIIVFIVIPLIIMWIFRTKMNNTPRLGKNAMSDNMLLQFFITQLLSFAAYLILMSINYAPLLDFIKTTIG